MISRNKLAFFSYQDTRHKDFVLGLAWHPEDNRLFSCGYDTAVLQHKIVESEGLASPLADMVIVTDKEKSEQMDVSVGDSAWKQ